MLPSVRADVRVLTPAGIELSLTAAGDIERERGRLDEHWRRELERAAYEVRLAQRSYRAVDPENRLVARTLELQWEAAMRHEQEFREGYDRFRRELPRRLTKDELDRIRALAANIPSLWNAADTPAADRKEIVHALIERATVTMPCNAENVVVRIQWIGGASTEHALRRPISCYDRLADFPRMWKLVEAAVAAGQTSAQIAERLDRESFRPPSSRADRFTPERARGAGLPAGHSARGEPARAPAGRRMVGPRPGGRNQRGLPSVQGVSQRRATVPCSGTSGQTEASGDLGRCGGAGTTSSAQRSFPSRQDECYPAELTRPKSHHASGRRGRISRNDANVPKS